MLCRHTGYIWQARHTHSTKERKRKKTKKNYYVGPYLIGPMVYIILKKLDNFYQQYLVLLTIRSPVISINKENVENKVEREDRNVSDRRRCVHCCCLTITCLRISLPERSHDRPQEIRALLLTAVRTQT